MRLALALLVGFFAACGGDSGAHPVDGNSDALTHCDPRRQTGCAAGEKCTWFIDSKDPSHFIGHIGCAPDGSAKVGEACMFGAPGETGVDNCKSGGVCSRFRGDGAGFCKQICDQAGGVPTCDPAHVCVVYPDLFSTGEMTPAAAGVCDLACDPFTDNDFDGSASSPGSGPFSKRTTACGSDPAVGCHARPSLGTPPATSFTCTDERNYEKGSANAGVGLRHRAQCLLANGCANDGPTKVYENGCNQGYEPLLEESTEVSTRICVATCKPTNCYAGNCGTSNANRAGAVGDGCRATDRVIANGGTWDGATAGGGGEHCQFMWFYEISNDNKFLKSKYSNTTGLCYDHAAYKFNKDGDANTGVGGREAPLPDCATLQDGVGSGSNPSDPDYYGAAELGCVDTTHAGFGPAADGKSVTVPEALMRKRALLDLPRPLYRRELDQR